MIHGRKCFSYDRSFIFLQSESLVSHVHNFYMSAHREIQMKFMQHFILRGGSHGKIVRGEALVNIEFCKAASPRKH